MTRPPEGALEVSASLKAALRAAYGGFYPQVPVNRWSFPRTYGLPAPRNSSNIRATRPQKFFEHTGYPYK